MTAATVEASVATTLGLEHPSAIRLADQLATVADDGIRRAHAARALADRRADLVLYRALLVERYGNATPSLDRIVAADALYGDLVVLTVA